MSIRERKKKREAMRRWRARHPIMAAWHDHRHHAKERGISILWDFGEFFRFCTETGYHILKGDGFQLHRERDRGPYAYGRVSMIPGEINRKLQTFYAQRLEKRRLQTMLAHATT